MINVWVVCFQLLQEDLLIHGDSVFDIIDKQDHAAIQAELSRSPSTLEDEERLFLCRMNVSRNARRQMRFGDQKVCNYFDYPYL
jgi:hypothetical protein